MRQLSTLMNFGTPSPSKPPKKKKQKTKSQVKVAAAQGQGQGQAQCQGTTPISNPSCSPMQHIIQVGNETYHQMQPMQHIQPMQQAMQCSTSFQNHPNSTYSNTPNTSHIPHRGPKIFPYKFRVYIKNLKSLIPLKLHSPACRANLIV